LLEEIFGRIDNFEDMLTEIGSLIQRLGHLSCRESRSTSRLSSTNRRTPI
jgi:hypothetical protein